jgi:hypothetical protein
MDSDGQGAASGSSQNEVSSDGGEIMDLKTESTLLSAFASVYREIHPY